METSGEPLFATLYADPARLKEFLPAMTGVSRGADLAIANKFPWENYMCFADIGAGQGDWAVQITLANSHLSGTGFDLPEADVLLMEHILHDSNLEEEKGLIRKAYEALPGAERLWCTSPSSTTPVAKTPLA